MLLAEDDDILRETLFELFSEANFSVTAVINGLEAMNCLRQEKFSILVSDLHMQPMNGLMLLESVRANAEWNSMPIIILTADPLNELRIKSLEGGVNDYMNKPFSFKELILRIENLLEVIASNQKSSAVQLNNLVPHEIHKKIQETFLNRLDDYLLRNLNQNIEIDALAEYCRLSRSGLDKKLRQHLATSASHYIRRFKLQKAKELLETSQLSVKEVSQLTGFNSLSYFSTCFTRHFGYPPKKYRL